MAPEWIQAHKNAKPEQLEAYLREVHRGSEHLARFPDGF